MMPVHRDRQEEGLARKRREYAEVCEEYVSREKSESEIKLLKQIQVDLPRMCPGPNMGFFLHPRVQGLMERALYVWALRHPASGYVQGINDLITPLIAVFLSPKMPPGETLESLDLNACISQEELEEVEADAYWGLTKILGDIQDNYIIGQPGIQRAVLRLKEIVRRVDESLHEHLTKNDLDLLHVAFRWLNCLLLREFSLRCGIRLWDTLIAEQDGFSVFHVYVCAVFLVHWGPALKDMDFQQMMLFMQKFPTSDWTPQDVDTLLAEAFVLKSLFHQSPKHLGP